MVAYRRGNIQHSGESDRIVMEEELLPQSTTHATAGRSLPVLLVDDEPRILDLLCDVLEEEGLTVLTATNGAAALYLVQQTPIGLVLTDFMMPGISGIELAHQLHSNPQTATIPLLLMSAALPQQVSPLFAAVIPKPFSVEHVVRIVRQFLAE